MRSTYWRLFMMLAIFFAGMVFTINLIGVINYVPGTEDASWVRVSFAALSAMLFAWGSEKG